MSDNIKILLADDHQIMIDGISALLEPIGDIEIVARVKNGKDAVQHCAILKPHVVLMDLDMPIMSGKVAAAKIKEEHPEIAVIILSLHNEKSVIQHLIQNGIDGYLIKSSSSEEVVQAIRAVHEGRKYFSTDTTLALTSLQSQSSPKPNSSDLQLLNLLSARETEVLKAIGEGFTNKEIAQQLFLSTRTIDAHRANIMKKLEINKVTGLVRLAIKSGLVD